MNEKSQQFVAERDTLFVGLAAGGLDRDHHIPEQATAELGVLTSKSE